MILNNRIGRIFLIWLSLSAALCFYPYLELYGLYTNHTDHISTGKTGGSGKMNFAGELDSLNQSFEASIIEGDTAKSRHCRNLILSHLGKDSESDTTASDSKYLLGVFSLLSGKNMEAINWFRSSSSIREHLKYYDEVLAKCLYNMAIAYNNLGDFNRMEQNALRSHEIEKNIFGNSSPMLIGGLSALVTAYINLNDYDTAISYGNKALKLIEGSSNIDYSIVALLYTNIGTSHARLSDYSKALLFLEKAESIYNKYSCIEDDNYINLINNLGATYFFLGQFEKSDEYFTKGLSKIKTSNSAITLNFLNSFAILLGNSGNIKRGEAILENSLEKAGEFFGKDSRDYLEVVKNNADYLRIYNINLDKSIKLYEQCLPYLEIHVEDLTLSNAVYLGYAIALDIKGESHKSLDIIQKLLFQGLQRTTAKGSLASPAIEMIRADQWSIKLLKAKHSVLRDIYSKEKDDNILMAALETSELIVGLLDKVRMNISEDESRLLLGDRFRDSYLFSISDINLCYKATGKELFLKKAFEYSEKSKVAGLLAATRELKATQFHIPDEIADLERKLKSEISFYNSKIEEEQNAARTPDYSLISEWKELIIRAVNKRDSLIKLFESQYPEYYLIKYNTAVLNPENISDIGGRDINYLNYVVSDTTLYIVLTNRKLIKLISIPVDSIFFSNIREFRSLLTFPQNDARKDFKRYMETGTSIYKKIFEPVKDYLISDRLLISPDGIISYIPFEAIPEKSLEGENNLFKGIIYLMKDYRISYTYSATLLSESATRNNKLSNSLVAFAPVYKETINVDSLLKTRNPDLMPSRDLPFARMEAEYVSDMTGGTLYVNEGATEAAYKSEAGKYDIIHLAMHTILNDQYPMQSKMLFYPEKDSPEDGRLNTYEVYGIPLHAKMVMLSSCNTGSGLLHSGEGIMSLARGFVYSGSQSVVMSMWEIEDRSGAEIVESFYRYLKRGASKSSALRKARIKYLENADMLRYHPYFWSSLVIYGNNKPLYNQRKVVAIISVIVMATASILIFHYRKSR